ncbi:MAG: PP2C family protein-serine/threonine phosphatase, partial [Planctomycetota bacterium]
MSGDGSDRTAAMHLPDPDPESGESVPLVLVNVSGESDVGLRRTNNEDSLLVADLDPEAGVGLGPAETIVGPKGVLLAVSDGMGGHEAGEVASALAVKNLHESLKESWSAHPARDAFEELRNDLRNSVTKANRAVLEDAHENPSREGMGATLTAGVVFGQSLLVVHVGDSRCYLLRDGVLKCVTQDQSLAEELVKRGIVQRDSRAYDARKSVLTRVIGQKSKLEPDAELVHLARGDRLLFCSDGLYGPVEDDIIQDVLRSGEDPKSTVSELIAEAKRGGAPDNVTCVVAWLDGDGLPSQEELDVGGATMSIAMDVAELQGAGDATLQFSASAAERTGEFKASDVAGDQTLQDALAAKVQQVDP